MTPSLNRRDTGVAHPVDVFVGGRLRQRRTYLGLSQEKLGKNLGLTFQQVQKYERGANRIGASRLYELADILDVPVNFFFEGYDFAEGGSHRSAGIAEGSEDSGFEDPMMSRESVELIRSYYSIQDESIRRKFLDLARALSASDDEPLTLSED